MNEIHDLDHQPADSTEAPRKSARLPYDRPAVKCDRLSLITRGGTVGGGDSGDTGSEQPLGPSMG